MALATVGFETKIILLLKSSKAGLTEVRHFIKRMHALTTYYNHNRYRLCWIMSEFWLWTLPFPHEKKHICIYWDNSWDISTMRPTLQGCQDESPRAEPGLIGILTMQVAAQVENAPSRSHSALFNRPGWHLALPSIRHAVIGPIGSVVFLMLLSV